MKHILTLIAVLVPGMLLGATYYVDASRPDDSGDGLSWAAAKKTIQAAADLTVEGDIVLVTNGVYDSGGEITPGLAISNRVVITNSILVTSVNGPAHTIIAGAGPGEGLPTRCVYLSAGLLSGFTLSNGSAMVEEALWEDGHGGGAYMPNNRGTLSNCIICCNAAAYDGGGTYRGTVLGCVISSNKAMRYGGGAAGGVLQDCIISNNSAPGGGAAKNTVIINCMITDNHAGWGGGAYDCSISNSTIWGNRATSAGGMYIGTAHNSSIWGNRAAHQGGGAYYSHLFNCTVSGNCAGQRGSGVADAVVKNSIVYCNDGENWSGGAFMYSCTLPLPPGSGNISNEPLLLDTVHIHAHSPCVGAGNALYTSGTDIDGEPWHAPPSMGCDEVYAAALTGVLHVSIAAPSTAAVAGARLEFTAVITGMPTSNVWSLGDSSAQANSAYVQHAWELPGNYMVVLAAFNDDNPAGVSATVHVMIVAVDAMTFYVDAANPAPNYPYHTWNTAATTIQNAVDAAEATGVCGARVCVTNGVYVTGERLTPGETGSNRVVIAGNIVVMSVNGPAHTFIVGQGPLGEDAVRCVRMFAGVLSGFTLTNGFALNSGGGVSMEGGSACVSNCVISASASGFRGGGGAYGTFLDTRISGNTGWQGGGAAYATLHACTLDGNTAEYCGGVFESTVIGCVLTSNTGCAAADSTVVSCLINGNTGGGARNCTLYTSVIASNSASWGAGIFQCTAENCAIIGNAAHETGGGAAFGRLWNCLVIHNTAATAGGVYESGLENCTIAHNHATLRSGGIELAVNWNIARNCIIYFNQCSDTPATSNCFVEYGTIIHSCTAPQQPGSFSITSNPRFINAAENNYRLRYSSPCINAGYEMPGIEAWTDLDGNPRVIGGRVDMGAYEYSPSTNALLPPVIEPDTLLFPGANGTQLDAGMLTNIVWRVAGFWDNIDGMTLLLPAISILTTNTGEEVAQIGTNVPNLWGTLAWTPWGLESETTAYVVRIEAVNSSGIRTNRVFSDNVFTIVPEPGGWGMIAVFAICSLQCAISRRRAE